MQGFRFPVPPISAVNRWRAAAENGKREDGNLIGNARRGVGVFFGSSHRIGFFKCFNITSQASESEDFERFEETYDMPHK